MSNGPVPFRLYRYQILPINRHQLGLFPPISIEELLALKNVYFAEALAAIQQLDGSTSIALEHVVTEQPDFFLMRIAANRSLQHETRDFKTEQIDNWPKVYMAVSNIPDQQIIAVQRRTAAFKSTDTVVRSLIEATSQRLRPKNLTVLSERISESQTFWRIVDMYQHRIKSVEFELITPNMANISGALSEDLKALAKETNAVTTDVTLAAAPNASLEMSENDDRVRGLVDYANNGGGDIKVRIEGIRRAVHTKDTFKEVSVDSVFLEGTSPEGIADALKKLLTP